MTSFFQAPLSEAQLDEIAASLDADQLVVIPTETVYGLAASAFSESAIRAIFEAKKRPANNPVIVHIAKIEGIVGLVSEVPEIAQTLAKAFWPGPLTMVFKKSPELPSVVCAGGDTVGIRVPRQASALKIIEKAGPVAAPSANIYTELSPTSADQLSDALLGAVSIVVDGGPTQVGIESTVLSVVDNKPVLLRPGMISAKEISDLLGMPVYYKSVALDDDESRPSPGLSKKHYSPKTPVVLGIPESSTERVAFISYRPHQLSYVEKQVQLPDSPAEYAARIYATLHELDAYQFDKIYVEQLPQGDQWRALRDRLERASV